MSERKIKWGILAPGNIAHQFMKDMKFVANAEVVAVASRTLDKAKTFAETYQIARAYGSYEELTRDPEVDIVYIASPHTGHKEHTLLCLRAGKAVLCEKPVAVNAAEAAEMIDCAKENNVFFMEAMWSRFLPTMRKVKEWLNSGAIGEVGLVRADFGFRAGLNPESRLFNPALAGGALLDVGVYCVAFASWVYGGEKPLSIASQARIGETGVDEVNGATFHYENGGQTTITSAIRLSTQHDALIYGSEGSIHIPQFWCAKTATLKLNGRSEERFESVLPARGYAFEAEEAGRCLPEGLLESPGIPWSETLSIMETMDAMRKQWGLKYPME